MLTTNLKFEGLGPLPKFCQAPLNQLLKWSVNRLSLFCFSDQTPLQFKLCLSLLLPAVDYLLCHSYGKFIFGLITGIPFYESFQTFYEYLVSFFSLLSKELEILGPFILAISFVVVHFLKSCK